ncbi:hypothetical protein [Chamaesiphon sp. OTE_8_metabat_110]|uniref:hypothetical protein n=1 Tax=Chamaesiphon sp. OTE_8_metabat_110 TaxID=2964696 RepID=UPI00286BE289|nr:hypothetical protein [Chamaesiphon sp. OTE_8_metabat_110]
MQGLFGRFGKQKPAQPTIDLASIRQQRQSRSEFQDAIDSSQQDWGNDRLEEKDLPIANRFDTDDEETNWDDAETLGNDNNPLVPLSARQPLYAQPVAPIVAPTLPPTSDLDEWDEALPAATVQSSHIQEARRSKQRKFLSPNEDIWDDDITGSQENIDSVFSASGNLKPTAFSTDEPTNQPRRNYVSGLWTGTLDRFRRLLPAPLRQLSEAILIAILVAIVTVGIWFVDGFFVPGIDRSVTAPPPTPLVIAPINSDPKISPEQAFTQAIQSQLSEITSQYPDNIIEMLNIDIDRDRLIVQLDPSWYTLDDDRQNTLTDRMWLQAQSHHFTKLEIRDSQGVAIARSPVVGKHPIILQRRSS